MTVSQAINPGSAVSVGTSNTALVGANDRRSVVLCNDHASNTIYLSLGGTAVANQGIRLNAAGGAIKLDGYTGAVSAIATGASTAVTVAEY